jgi:Protein of unknown function (DUF3558)
MKKPMTFLFVTTLLGASLLAACGQAATPSANSSAPADAQLATASPKSTVASSSSSKVDACTLLSKDEVGKVLGETVGASESKGLGGVCSYTTANLTFELTVSHTGGTDYLKTTRAKLGDLALDVPGLGDEAFYNTNSIVNTLFVRVGDAAYLLDVMNNPGVQGPSPEALRAMEKALGEQLVTNLH